MTLQRIALFAVLGCVLSLGGIVLLTKTSDVPQLPKPVSQRTPSIINASKDHEYEKVIDEILTEIKTQVWPTTPEPVPIGDDIAWIYAACVDYDPQTGDVVALGMTKAEFDFGTVHTASDGYLVYSPSGDGVQIESSETRFEKNSP
ncbi:MAG: hypothetical protein AAF585_26705 [Verrucomicrobiota bacterium]